MISILVMIFISCYLKRVLFSFGYFKELLTLELLSSKIEVRVLSVVWPARENAQDVLYWWARPVVGVQFYRLFGQNFFCVLLLFLIFRWFCFLFFDCVLLSNVSSEFQVNLIKLESGSQKNNFASLNG